MPTPQRTLWTIDELEARAALALSVDYDGQPNGQVREVPDRRNIRYYTTLGLLDRPAAMRGRTALYGRRHLLQLVAIKRLQARGLSLAEIQHALLGQTDATLARIARLPGDDPAEPGRTGPPEPPPRGDFWKAIPAPTASVRSRSANEGPGPNADRPPDDESGPRPIPLAEGVTLSLRSARPLYEDDWQAIRSAAAPLLKLLARRRLLGPASERRSPSERRSL